MTEEVLGWVDDYHAELRVKQIDGEGKWLFAGEKGGHAVKMTGYEAVKTLFQKAGLNDGDDYIYSPHSMRKFAISWMRKRGVQEGAIDAIVGHVSRTKKVYDDFDEIEQEWASKCRDFRWMSPQEIHVKDPKAEREIEKLRSELEATKGFMAGVLRTLAEMKAQMTGKQVTPRELEDLTKDAQRAMESGA